MVSMERCPGIRHQCKLIRYCDVHGGEETLDGWMCTGCVSRMDGQVPVDPRRRIAELERENAALREVLVRNIEQDAHASKSL